MKDKNIAIEATYWYSLLEKVEKDQNILPVCRKMLRIYIKKELLRIRKEIEKNERNTF